MKPSFRLFAVIIIALLVASALFIERKAAGSSRVVIHPANRVANSGAPFEVCTPPPSGMVSWWPGENNANDIQGGNNGSLHGSPSFSSGKVGQAFNLAVANSQFVDIPDSPSLRLSNLTIDAWVNFNSIPGGGPTIFGKTLGGADSNSYIMWYAGGQLHGYTANNSGDGPILSYSWTPTLDTWYHVAYTFDGSNHALYINGLQVATGANTFVPSYDGHAARIGADYSHEADAFYFDGLIDEVELFNRALTPDEILHIFLADAAGKCQVSSITIGDATVPAGGGTTITFPVTVARADANAGDITVNYTTVDGTAHASSDYTSTQGVLTIPAGHSSASIPVTVNPAATGKDFRVNLTNPSTNAMINGAHGPDNNGAFWAVGTIYACDPPPDGLIGWWPGEGNGNDVQSGNNGTPQGGASYRSGKVGQAFSFNPATNDEVRIPDSPSLRPKNFTIDAWVNFNSTVGGGCCNSVFGKALGNGNADSYDVWYQGNALHGLTCANGSTGSCVNLDYPFTPTIGAWYHVAYTFDGSNHTLYVNGQQVATAGNTTVIGYDNNFALIGADTDSTGPLRFDGQIDEVELFDHALDAQQVSDLYTSAAAGKCITPSLVINDISVSPGNSGTTPANFTVTAIRTNGTAIDVHYATADGTGTTGATAGTDYVATSGTLHFDGNETSKTIPVTVNGVTRSSSKNFTLTLSSPSNAVLNHPTGTGTILTGNAAQDFSSSNNPNGSWSFGYTNPLAGTPVNGVPFNSDSTFNVHDLFLANVAPSLDEWYSSQVSSPDRTPGVYHNASGGDLNFGVNTLPAGMLALHPGIGNQYSVIRWIAPATGTYVLRGRFAGIDHFGTSTDVHIVKNLTSTATHLADASINGYGSEFPFVQELSVTANDTIDFMVGPGSNNYSDDTTALKAEFTPGSLTCDSPPSDVVSWWTGDTDAKDFKGGNDGTLQGGATAGVATGEVGKAFNFVAGNSQYVSIPDNPSLHQNHLTIDAWVNFNSFAVNSIFGKGFTGGDADSYAIYYYAGALHGITCDGPSFGSSCTELAYPWNPGLGTWHHVAYTFDSSTHKLFVDGREVASGANTRVPAYDNTEVRIGADVDTGGLYQFDGKIDEVGFFSRALPASEIAGIYNAGSAGRCKVIPTGVSAVSGSGTYLGTATLTATLGANSSGLPGQTVDFTLNNNSVGSAQTDANGVATLNSVSLTGINAGNYNDAVVATFAGDATYGTSTANGTLSVSKADQMITIDSVTHAPASADYNSQFNVAATSDSGLTVAFSSSGSCSNTGAQFTMTSGTGQCTVKYDQAGNTNYNAAPQKTETVNAQKLNQTITVNTHAPANANYNSQFNVAATASSGLAVTFSNSGVCSNAAAQFTMTSGTGQCTVNYDQAGNANYNAAPQIGETVNAQKLNQTITFNPNPLPDKTFGDADFGVSASSDANLTVSFSAGVNDKCTVTTGTVHLTGAGSCTITASQAGDSNYNSAADVLRPFNIAKGTPIITWSNPADIVYGTALGATQLNATASVAGNNFVYTPASVTVLHAGNRTLHVDFTPDDTTNYNNASKDVTINVTKATLTVTADDKAKTYRAANPALTFAPSGFVNGDTSSILSGSPTLNTTATTTSAVSGYPITIVQGTLSAVHGGFDDYTLSFVNGALTINKTTPVVSWNNPANIVYGTALSGTQLNATATNPNDGSSVAGVFNYSPNGGTVLHVGNSQTLATNFVPTESNNYNTPAQKTAFMNVIPATLTITADNKSRPLNTANPPLTYTPTGFVNGDSASVLTGAPDLNTTAVQNSPIGDYPITITQGNLSASDYTFNFVNGNLAVGKTTPVINWSNPADIVYGTALSGTQLNATATDPGTNAAVPGTFTYTPAAGTVLHVGANQLAMTFTPTDTTNYSPPAQKLVSINVTKATLTITADNKAKTYRAANPALTFTPTGFVNGDTSSVLSGTPTISTTATAISVVSGYPISITQNNLSAVDYTFNFVSGTLTVNKATPVINWSNPSDIVYGTALSGTQLNAGATNPNDGSAVTGAFAYSPIGTTVLHVGNGQTLRADFTPNGVDASSYNLAAQKQVAINVTKATLTITADNKSKAFGAANPALTFTPSGFVNGDSASVLTGAPNLSTTATQSSPVASYPITIAQGTLVATDYSFNFVNGTLTVGKIMPVITWTNPAAIVYGTGLSATQLNATATDPNTNAAVAGIFTYSPAPGSVLHVGNGQSLSVNFAPTDTTNYGPPPAKNVSINVLKATLTITANNTSKSYRAANPASFNFTPSGFVNGDGAAVLSGAPSFSTTATTTSTAGGYPITPGPGTLSASDYGFNFVNGTLTVNPVTPTINWSNPLDIFFGTPLSATQLNATATNPNDNSTVTGAFVYNPAAGAVLNAGSNQTLTANFTPNGSDASSYNSPAAKNVSINISMSVQTINFGNLVNKQVGDAPFTVSATSTSGLPVTFGIVAGPATITGNTVTLTGPGSVTVRAAQIGNGNFNAASSVEQSFLVTSAPGLTPSNGNFVVSYSSTFPGLPSGIFELFPTSRLTRFSALIGFGSSWSPDGTKIAYSQSWKPGAHFHLSMASADGTNTARLDSNEADRELDTNPAWSPDGKSIAYNCDFAGDGNSPLICVRKLTDFWWTVVQEASGPIKVSGQGAPAWSPDSKRLVFSAQEGSIGGGQFALYIYDLTTKAYTRLSHAAGIVPSSQQPFSDMTPAWSPDGTRIVYKSPTGLSIINPDGSNKRDIPNTASTRSPKWSSDMKQVAFIGSALSDPSRQAINVINLDGTNLAEIYSNPSPLFSGLLTFDWQAVPVNVTTPTGNGVIVGDGPGSLRFSNVNTGGTTSVIAITPESAGSMPGGFAIDGSSLAWDVTTTASYTGPVEACFHIYGSNETAAQFNARRVMHGENGVLVDRTSRHDYASGEICATVNSLSPFAVVTNLNPTTTNEIDDQNRFVGQHYLDFLDRPSDPTGQAFWVGTITSCGSDQNCIAVKRINASAAFFMSIEFQQEGYLVERAYKAAYGDTTGTSTLNGDHQMTVPIVRLGQFLDDSAEVGQGVVVNQGNWEQQLNTNKDAFTLDFVQRQGFIDAYPTTLTPIALVNKLFTNTGVTPTANELATAIGRFSGASDSSDTTARAKALRDVAENSTFTKNEMNRAWVLMEYFGYLRRNPNEGQDTDYTGYDFWLTKLNQFNGDFVQAEMVKAFVSSREYRQRFGPN